MPIFREVTGQSVRSTYTEGEDITALSVGHSDSGLVKATFGYDPDVDNAPIEERTMILTVRPLGREAETVSLPLLDVLWLVQTLEKEIQSEINQG